MKLTLQKQWKERCKLHDEAFKLHDESDKLYAESRKLRDESDKLRDEGNKLWDEGCILNAEGTKLWDEAILEAFGDIGREWKNYKAGKGYDCHLENGEVYVPNLYPFLF